jgi:hypothetical protein
VKLLRGCAREIDRHTSTVETVSSAELYHVKVFLWRIARSGACLHIGDDVVSSFDEMMKHLHQLPWQAHDASTPLLFIAQCFRKSELWKGGAQGKLGMYCDRRFCTKQVLHDGLQGDLEPVGLGAFALFGVPGGAPGTYDRT